MWYVDNPQESLEKSTQIMKTTTFTAYQHAIRDKR